MRSSNERRVHSSHWRNPLSSSKSNYSTIIHNKNCTILTSGIPRPYPNPPASQIHKESFQTTKNQHRRDFLLSAKTRATPKDTNLPGTTVATSPLTQSLASVNLKNIFSSQHTTKGRRLTSAVTTNNKAMDNFDTTNLDLQARLLQN